MSVYIYINRYYIIKKFIKKMMKTNSVERCVNTHPEVWGKVTQPLVVDLVLVSI